MDGNLRKLLTLAEHLVERGWFHIVRSQALIAELDVANQHTREAREFLIKLEQSMQRFIAHRDRMLTALNRLRRDRDRWQGAINDRGARDRAGIVPDGPYSAVTVNEAYRRDGRPPFTPRRRDRLMQTVSLYSMGPADVSFGGAALPAGKRRKLLAQALDGLIELFGARVLPCDARAAWRSPSVAFDCAPG